MTVTASKINLLDLDRRDLEAFFVTLGEKPFRATQVMKWIYHERVIDFAAMTNLSKALRERLADCAEIRLPEVALDQASRDGSHKWLIRLDSGNCIETVFIPEPDRGTLCVSSQIGCPLDCSFCATAQQGFNRNLTVAEIIGQVWQASRLLGERRNGDRIITNIVLMGMGEPLLNFANVVKATDLMQDDLAFGISKRRVTLSTAGVVPALYRLREVSEVSLAVSLHAPTDELRNELVPLNRKYPLAELLAACKNYIVGQTAPPHHLGICAAGGGQRFRAARPGAGGVDPRHPVQSQPDSVQPVSEYPLPALQPGRHRPLPCSAHGP